MGLANSRWTYVLSVYLLILHRKTKNNLFGLFCELTVTSDHQNARISSLSPRGRTKFKELATYGAHENGTDNLRT